MQSNSLRQMAADWVRANCAQEQLQCNFLESFDRAEQRGGNCFFTIGNALTKRGKPYLRHFHAGELFAFELTPR